MGLRIGKMAMAGVKLSSTDGCHALLRNYLFQFDVGNRTIFLLVKKVLIWVKGDPLKIRVNRYSATRCFF